MIRAFAVLGVLALAACQEPIGVGREVPDFSAISLDSGKTIDFRATYGGSVTLVNVWATWCEPCKEEIPALQRLYQRLGPKGFRIAAVSIDKDDSTKVRAFMNGFGVTFDVLHDPENRIQQLFQGTGVPESFLVDKDGMIVRIVYGDHPWDSPANQRIIEQLLDRPAS